MSNNFIMPKLDKFSSGSKKLGNKSTKKSAKESTHKKEKKTKEKSMFTNNSKLFLIAFIVIAIIVIIILYFKNKDSDNLDKTNENIHIDRGSENRKNEKPQETRIDIPDKRKGILKQKTDKEYSNKTDESESVEDLGSIDDSVVIDMEKTIDDEELIKYIED